MMSYGLLVFNIIIGSDSTWEHLESAAKGGVRSNWYARCVLRDNVFRLRAYLIVVVDFQVQNLESNLTRFEFPNGL
jgi:hypothetical protein